MKEIETELNALEEIDIKSEEENKIEIESSIEKHKEIDPKPLLNKPKRIFFMNNNLFAWIVIRWNHITEIYFHVYCIATFEVIFFFHYIVSIESDQMKMLIKNFERKLKMS